VKPKSPSGIPSVIAGEGIRHSLLLTFYFCLFPFSFPLRENPYQFFSLSQLAGVLSTLDDPFDNLEKSGGGSSLAGGPGFRLSMLWVQQKN
jgi:hypothetical protein